MLEMRGQVGDHVIGVRCLFCEHDIRPGDCIDLMLSSQGDVNGRAVYVLSAAHAATFEGECIPKGGVQ